MSEYGIGQVYPGDTKALARVEALLQAEGIRLDKNLDYTCAMYDHDGTVIATGSCFGNTLRCMAVSSAHQGEALMNEIVTHLMQVQTDRGNMHLFLYTKCTSAQFFQSLGFSEIARIENTLVFMENRRKGFESWVGRLAALAEPDKQSAAIVMNANPFTRGHRYLVEKAAAENDLVHLFVVSEDKSLFPAAVRRRLVQEGTADLPNVRIHDSGSYIISAATFPGYFQKDEEAVVQSQAYLDVMVFIRIARAMGITRRYVGSEPTSMTTNTYNRIMAGLLPQQGIECHIIPRVEQDGAPISASSVRVAIAHDQRNVLQAMLPPTTLQWLDGPEAAPVIAAIKNSADLVHH